MTARTTHRTRAGVAALAVLAGGLWASNTTPASAAAVTPATVSVGANSSCAVMSDQTVRCWGSNAAGLLGDGSGVDHASPVTVMTNVGANNVALKGIKQVEVGTAHACALSTAGRVLCWGSNRDGGVGNNSYVDRVLPTDVTPAGATVKGLSVGTTSSCLWTTGNTLYCWGRGEGWKPTVVATPAYPIIEAGVGDYTMCVALDAPSGTKDYMCKGDNSTGQFGDGTTKSSATLKGVADLGAERRVLALGSSHMCRLIPGSFIRCTGNNVSGQLGDWSTTSSKVMVDVPGTYTTMSAASQHTCAYRTQGESHDFVSGPGYVCWGLNEDGAGGWGWGLSDVMSRPSSVWPASTAVDKPSIDTAARHTCAVNLDSSKVRRVFCWGADTAGQLGRGTAGFISSEPKVVSGI